MKRREFIGGLGGVVAWPLVARAQQSDGMSRLAIITPTAPVAEIGEVSHLPAYRVLFGELRKLGYVEGRNLIVERYSAEGRPERYPDLAREVARTRPDLILATTNLLVTSLQAATDTIPIVGLVADPVEFGNVTSVARPDGNFTAITVNVGLEIWGKRLQILREALPTASRVGYLGSRVLWDTPLGDAIRQPAQQLGISIVGPLLESPFGDEEYRLVLEAMSRERAQALVVNDEPANYTYRQLIVDLAAAARLPAVYWDRTYVEIGGLLSYGSSAADVMRHAAGYIVRILTGTKPSDLPIYLESKYELLINLKVAMSLGLTFPTSLMVRADEVIE
jgi:putative tryptophan/tyrosine transport system substrate-binding protein